MDFLVFQGKDHSTQMQRRKLQRRNSLRTVQHLQSEHVCFKSLKVGQSGFLLAHRESDLNLPRPDGAQRSRGIEPG